MREYVAVDSPTTLNTNISYESCPYVERSVTKPEQSVSQGLVRVSGVTGSPRRFAATVAMLVVLASLPVLAVLQAGAAALARTSAVPGGPVTPFLAPPSPAPIVLGPPVVIVPHQPSAGG